MCNTSFRTGDTCWAIYQDQVLPGKIAWSDITPDIDTIYGVELPEISIENDAKTFVCRTGPRIRVRRHERSESSLLIPHDKKTASISRIDPFRAGFTEFCIDTPRMQL